MWEEVQLSPWGGGQDKRQVPKWEIEVDGKEEKRDAPRGKGSEKTGEWTFSKKEVDAKEPSWGTDEDLASGQEVVEDDRGRRRKKAANQANILNILSQLILEANEDKEDEEKEERRSRYPQSSDSSFHKLIFTDTIIACSILFRGSRQSRARGNGRRRGQGRGRERLREEEGEGGTDLGSGADGSGDFNADARSGSRQQTANPGGGQRGRQGRQLGEVGNCKTTGYDTRIRDDCKNEFETECKIIQETKFRTEIDQQCRTKVAND